MQTVVYSSQILDAILIERVLGEKRKQVNTTEIASKEQFECKLFLINFSFLSRVLGPPVSVDSTSGCCFQTGNFSILFRLLDF